jgi:ketosteroid isomerase-like protein
MKVRLLTLAGLAIGFASPGFAQEKAATPAAPNPFQALPANPSLVQQVEAINLKFDEACNKHDREALEALFTANAIHVSPHGTFIGRDAIGKYYADLFHSRNLAGRVTKINYVYTFGGDLCALGGWIDTIFGSRQAGGFLISVYTRVGTTWKIRTSVFNHATGP